MEKYCQLIKQQYTNSTGDSTKLFLTILSMAEEVGLDNALAYLEQAVTEKRLLWLDENLETFEQTDNPVFDGYRLFYEIYLGLSAPEDGEIIKQTEHKLVSRWWNRCPTLEVCQKLGLDTREICQKVYHKPVQEFLVRLNPKLRFDRNYKALRPQTAYCEEIISLAKKS